MGHKANTFSVFATRIVKSAEVCVCWHALGMAKEMDSTLHCRFTTFTASWKYTKWTNPSGANHTTVAGTRTPLERV